MKDGHRNRWDLPTLILWALFFAAGLVPEPFFYVLRELGAVATQRAFVNTSSAITVTFAAYLSLFAHRRCRESGASFVEAQARAFQVGVLALFAFLEMPTGNGTVEVATLLELVLRFRELPDDSLRGVVLFIGACKLFTWCYLLSLLLRYHAFGMRDVFTTMPTLFPSAHGSALLHGAGDSPDRAEAPPEPASTTQGRGGGRGEE